MPARGGPFRGEGRSDGGRPDLGRKQDRGPSHGVRPQEPRPALQELLDLRES